MKLKIDMLDHMNNNFSNNRFLDTCRCAFNDSDSSSKNIERSPGSGGLYILKQGHLLFDIVSSEQMHSEKISWKTTIFISISFGPYFLTIKIKLRVWKTFI